MVEVMKMPSELEGIFYGIVFDATSLKLFEAIPPQSILNTRRTVLLGFENILFAI